MQPQNQESDDRPTQTEPVFAPPPSPPPPVATDFASKPLSQGFVKDVCSNMSFGWLVATAVSLTSLYQIYATRLELSDIRYLYTLEIADKARPACLSAAKKVGIDQNNFEILDFTIDQHGSVVGGYWPDDSLRGVSHYIWDRLTSNSPKPDRLPNDYRLLRHTFAMFEIIIGGTRYTCGFNPSSEEWWLESVR